MFGLSDYNHHPSCSVITVSLGFLILGFFIHLMQKIFGPRLFLDFFLKTVKVHNYFGSSSLELTQSSELECPICYRDVYEVIPLEKVENAPYLSRGAQKHIIKNKIRVMRTPCGHCFHAVCLLTAMSYRLICPICKKRLPNVF